MMLRKILYKLIFSQKQKNEFLNYQTHKDTIQEYLHYLGQGTHLPVTHKIKQNNVQKYGKENNYQVFVETGTYLGDMVEAQKKHFKQLISIELGEDLFNKAVDRFKGD